jgi:TolB protein
MKMSLKVLPFLAITFFCFSAVKGSAQQGWVYAGTSLGQQPIRLAAADFKPVGTDPQTPVLKAVFDTTLFNDLSNAGIFDMVSKSMAPQAMPGSPQEINLAQWAAPPANATAVAFGALSVSNGRIIVYGWLYSTAGSTAAGAGSSAQLLGKQYNEQANQEEARTIAHEFADAIILQMGGIPGIAQTKIYFVSKRTGSKEIWAMDYDGENQHPVTHLGNISMAPRISPDNSRVAFETVGPHGWSVRMFSLDLGRLVRFPAGVGGSLNMDPSWSSNGNEIAFSSARTGESEIWIADEDGGNLRRITALPGPNVQPCWNPKTNAQIAFVSGRTGEPQIYIMNSDGSQPQRMTDGGYAVSPSWSPNGLLLTFAWNRKYGPGAPGGNDIYVFEIATMRWLQLTHGEGDNDYPSWAPDGRHIVFQRKVGKRTDLWSMLADGTHQQQLTHTGDNSEPDWSWK